MPISRAKKEQLVDEYKQQLNDSEAIFIADYRGLKVMELQKLRARIREAEGNFSIVKNTLIRRALSEAGLPVADEAVTGPIGVGFSDHNVTAVAKAMVDFARDNELFKIKCGIMGDRILDEAAIKALANLPSLEVVRAQLLGLINAPAAQLAGVLAGGVRQLVNVINAYAEKEGEAPAET
jgi:large subunit ribosomal protein L10